MLLAFIWIAAAAYLLGSVPVGYLLVLIFRRQDIRTVGSGNIGATNVLRSGGKGLGLATFALDVVKGAAAVLLAAAIAPHVLPMVPQRNVEAWAALFAVLGHMFPVWLKFRGGKGVATGFGVFLVAAPWAALARALLCGKLWHFDINDGYRLKHDVDIAVGLVNPLDWLNVLILLRSHGYNGPFNLDYKPPRTTSTHGVFAVSFPTAVDRFITLWEMAGEAMTDAIIKEATDALKAGGGAVDSRDADGIAAANRELLTLHELIAHRLVQILLGLHRGRTYLV